MSAADRDLLRVDGYTLLGLLAAALLTAGIGICMWMARA